MENMPKKAKLSSHFLSLEIYPDSPAYTSATTERFHPCECIYTLT